RAKELIAFGIENYGEDGDQGKFMKWLMRHPFEVEARAVKTAMLMRAKGEPFKKGPRAVMTTAVKDPAFGHEEFSSLSFTTVAERIERIKNPRPKRSTVDAVGNPIETRAVP